MDITSAISDRDVACPGSAPNLWALATGAANQTYYLLSTVAIMLVMRQPFIAEVRLRRGPVRPFIDNLKMTYPCWFGTMPAMEVPV